VLETPHITKGPGIANRKATRRGVALARIAAIAATALAAISGSGCRSVYLTRLAIEEAKFLRDARPATDLLATAQDPARRRALETLIEVRRFAADEGLHVGDSYRTVSDNSHASSFHVVTAAYADRLEPYTWWYPIVGSIPYRGYFDREPAEKFAAKLREEGLDTLIVEASAYSTLGWFDDPILSTMIRALDEALGDLAAMDATAAAVVELRFFGGMSVEEVAEALSVSKRTVEGDWTFARAWLRREMDRDN